MEDQNKKTSSVTVLVPVHNEQECLRTLLSRLSNSVKSIDCEWHFLFVDDFSTDDSLKLLKYFQETDPRIRIVTLSRRFGKEYAVSAGLANVQTDAVVIMDADLQDPPECLAQMVEHWQKGFDVVAMKRSDRQVDSWFKRSCAAGYYRIMQSIGDVPMPVGVGDYRLISKKVVDVLNLLPESNRNMKGLFAWVGFNTLELDYVREGRTAGETQWKFSKLVRLALDGITAHSIAPLRISTYLGALVATVALAFGLYTVIKTLFFGDPVPGYTTVITIMTLLGGLQLLCIGMLGEYVGRTFIESKRRPLYVVNEILHSKNADENTKNRTLTQLEGSVQLNNEVL